MRKLLLAHLLAPPLPPRDRFFYARASYLFFFFFSRIDRLACEQQPILSERRDSPGG